MYYAIITFFLCITINTLFAENKTSLHQDKIKFVSTVRQYYAKNVPRYKPKYFSSQKELSIISQKLNDDGFFSDITLTKAELGNKNWYKQGAVGKKIRIIFLRLGALTWALNKKKIAKADLEIKLYKAINNYCEAEISRPNVHRFHTSCYLCPTTAATCYFLLYNEINKKEASPIVVKLGKNLQKISFHAFTQPIRYDVNKPYSPNQYRNHVWWVGGNFAYRRVVLCAAACNDVKMFDTIWQVCMGAISTVSFNTAKTAFWNEGFTADGAAWGHGKQSYAFGYGIDSANGIMRILNKFKNSPWMGKTLTDEKFNILLNFASSMLWLQYRKRPCLTINGRHNLYAGADYSGKRVVSYLQQLSNLNPSAKVKEKIKNLREKFDKEATITATGTRYFWNNDDLVMRGKNYYAFVNMTCARSLGPESVDCDSRLNYNIADGSTMLLQKGDEYDYSKGAWDFSTPPGTTCRKWSNLPTKVTYWEGLTGKHNFAGGIGGDIGCCGFIFEKKVLKKYKRYSKILAPTLGVKAFKSYFMLDGIMVALGAGINNFKPEIDADIITNLNQTALRSPVIYGIGTQKSAKNATIEKTFDMSKIKKNLWCIQDDIAYIVMPQYTNSSVSIFAKEKETKWNLLSERNSKKKNLPKTVKFFSMSINHGKKPSPKLGGTYAYIVMMQCLSAKKVIEIIKSKRIEIVANNKKIQAVWDNKLKVAQMIIYSPSGIYNYNSLKVKSLSPAIVQVRKMSDGKMRISVADPLQNPNKKSIDLIINDQKISVLLPSKPLCGKSNTIDI